MLIFSSLYLAISLPIILLKDEQTEKQKIQNIIYLCGLWLNTTLSKTSSESIRHEELSRHK